jgi:hypothetical protein
MLRVPDVYEGAVSELERYFVAACFSGGGVAEHLSAVV